MLLGCSPRPTGDFIEAHGSFADGTPLDAHLPAQSALTTSAQPQLGMVMSLLAPAMGPEDFLGLRLEWFPASIQENQPLPSSNSGPVILYVQRAIPDAGDFHAQLAVIGGGAIDFTMNRRLVTGTLSNLVLSRPGQANIVTIASGSFQATTP
jgi:hypothetical protein